MFGIAPPVRPWIAPRNIARLAPALVALLFAATGAQADDMEFGVVVPRSEITIPLAPISSNNQKTSATIQGIFFDSDYDNGSIQDIVGAGTNTFNCTLFTEDGEIGTSKYHFRFKMTGVAGRTITLNIDHSNNPRPFVSLDGVIWRRTTSTEAPTNSRLVLSFGATENFAEVAFFDPLGYAEVNNQVNKIVDSGVGATTGVLGLSYQGRPMWLVTVTDNAVPATGKRRIWVHARVHSGEITASHVMLGILEKTTEDSAEGRRLRQNCIFNIVPTQNCDGVYLGLTRWDSQGIDPERQWDNPSRIPEVANMKAAIDWFMAGANPIGVALNLHSTSGNYTDTFFWKHLQPSVTTNFELVQQRFIDSFNNASALFDNLSPQTSQLNATIFPESYFWNNWGEVVMAMTYEGHYYRRITDNAYITGADYRQLGRDLASGMVEYFTLPAPSGVDDWRAYE